MAKIKNEFMTALWSRCSEVWLFILILPFFASEYKLEFLIICGQIII